MGNEEERQQRTLNGDTVEEDEEEDEPERDDFGDPMHWTQTKGGFNRFEMSSLFQKAVRRSDRELAMFASYELCRSGHADNFWHRVQVIMVEDLRLSVEEAHVPEAVRNLMELSQEKWSPDEGMGLAAAMRVASILAEAESSHEILLVKNNWNEIAEERAEAISEGEEPEENFPVSPDFEELEYQVHDMHTQSGKSKGRDFDHFLTVASRTSEETDLGMGAKEARMRRSEDEHEFTEEDYERALGTVPEDEPWEEEPPSTVGELDEYE